MDKSSKQLKEQPESPSIIQPGHRRDRVLSTASGAKKGWRNIAEHPLTVVFYSGRINYEQFAAGEFYRAFYEKMESGSRDSTQMVIAGSGGPYSQHRIDAIRIIEKVEQKLRDARQRILIRKFCGDGWSLSLACRAAGYSPKDTTDRIQSALGNLSTAITGIRIDFHRGVDG